MDNVRVKRIAYDQSVYERLKHLIPLGENVVKLTEDDHISRLLSPPSTIIDLDYDSLTAKIDRLKAQNSKERIHDDTFLTPHYFHGDCM